MNPLLVQGAATLLSGGARGTGLRNLLSMTAMGLLIFAGLGWYMDWYKVQRSAGPDGHQTIKIDVNTQEIRKDIQSAREKVGEALGTRTPGQPTSYPAPQGYPPQQGYPAQNYPPQQGYPAPTYPNQPYPVPTYPQQPNHPAAQTYPGTTYPPQGNWMPTTPTSQPRQYDGTYVFPGPQPAPYSPPPPTSSRPF